MALIDVDDTGHVAIARIVGARDLFVGQLHNTIPGQRTASVSPVLARDEDIQVQIEVECYVRKQQVYRPHVPDCLLDRIRHDNVCVLGPIQIEGHGRLNSVRNAPARPQGQCEKLKAALGYEPRNARKQLFNSVLLVRQLPGERRSMDVANQVLYRPAGVVLPREVQNIHTSLT